MSVNVPVETFKRCNEYKHFLSAESISKIFFSHHFLYNHVSSTYTHNILDKVLYYFDKYLWYLTYICYTFEAKKIAVIQKMHISNYNTILVSVINFTY